MFSKKIQFKFFSNFRKFHEQLSSFFSAINCRKQLKEVFITLRTSQCGDSALGKRNFTDMYYRQSNDIVSKKMYNFEEISFDFYFSKILR